MTTIGLQILVKSPKKFYLSSGGRGPGVNMNDLFTGDQTGILQWASQHIGSSEEEKDYAKKCATGQAQAQISKSQGTTPTTGMETSETIATGAADPVTPPPTDSSEPIWSEPELGGPAFEPELWNDNGPIQESNNCENYVFAGISQGGTDGVHRTLTQIPLPAHVRNPVGQKEMRPMLFPAQRLNIGPDWTDLNLLKRTQFAQKECIKGFLK